VKYVIPDLDNSKNCLKRKNSGLKKVLNGSVANIKKENDVLKEFMSVNDV